jgi:hypothetical protein
VETLDRVERLVEDCLALPADKELQRHLAGILLEESPINPAELFEMIADFLALFRIERGEWTKRCDRLFTSLRNAGLLSE